jgi:quercetin dioxygenase-like cupin family protein
MRGLVTGVNDKGESCVLQDEEVTFAEMVPGAGSSTIFETSEVHAPTGRPGPGPFYPLGLNPGQARWMISDFAPGAGIPIHHTDTVGFHIVLSGSADLVLDTAVHALAPGDCVVLTGVDHGWRIGPDGCRFSVVVVGVQPSQ